jgi:phosphopantetheine adenylyltransferase
MPKKITIYAGSFKPPHKGHLHLVKKMLKMTKDPDNPGIVYVFISKKEREPCDKITGEISKEIWKEYIETLPKKDQQRVRLILSKLTSPTQTAYGFVKIIAKKGDEFYLVKSAKNANNERFASFKTLKKNGVKIHELVLPGYEGLHATNMRKAIHTRKKKEFYKFLPNMGPVKKNRLWEKLKKLC